MDILFYGDPHGSFGPLIEACHKHQPQAAIMLGDMQLTQSPESVFAELPKTTALWCIHGNHDTDTREQFEHCFESSLNEVNLHGRVVTIAGYRIAGLGGVFRHKTYHPQSNPEPQFPTRDAYLTGPPVQSHMPVKHHSSIWLEDIENFKGQQADILVTHEAPSSHELGFAKIDELAEMLGVKIIVHGHHHENTWQTLNLTHGEVRVMGVALAASRTLDGHVI